MMNVVEFEEIILSETMTQYSVRMNHQKYLKRYSIWVGYYLLFFLMSFSIAIIALRENIWLGSVLLFLFTTFVLYLIADTVIEERIIIIKQFGIQLSCKYTFGTEKMKFIDKDRLEAVFIHEYIYGTQIRYSVAFIIRDEGRLTLVFKYLNPGFANIKRVYQECLKEI